MPGESGPMIVIIRNGEDEPLKEVGVTEGEGRVLVDQALGGGLSEETRALLERFRAGK